MNRPGVRRKPLRRKKKPIRLLRLPLVIERTGWSRTTIYRKVLEGKLSKPVHLLGDRCSAWPEDEIDSIIAAAIDARDAAEVRP